MKKEVQLIQGKNIKLGWEKMLNNFVFFLPFIILMGLFYFGFFIVLFFPFVNSFVKVILTAVMFVMCLWFSGALMKASLILSKEKKVTWSDVWEIWPKLFNYLMGSIIYGLMVLIGFLFFILPGIFLIIKFDFISWLIIDQNMNFVEAIKKAWSITEKGWWDLFWQEVLFLFINHLGFLFLGVGLIFTLPATSIGRAYAYREFLKNE